MQLAKTEYLAGDDYTIADIAAYTWLGNLYHGAYNRCDNFLGLDEYENVGRWVKAIDARPAAIRGRLVNTQAMAERHSRRGLRHGRGPQPVRSGRKRAGRC